MTYTEELAKKKKWIISSQLLKSGTSIGALVREAQSAESRLDFIHKLKIANKEAYESKYWLLLCKGSINYKDPPEKLFEMITSMKKLLNAIISSAKSKIN